MKRSCVLRALHLEKQLHTADQFCFSNHHRTDVILVGHVSDGEVFVHRVAGVIEVDRIGPWLPAYGAHSVSIVVDGVNGAPIPSPLVLAVLVVLVDLPVPIGVRAQTDGNQKEGSALKVVMAPTND